MLSAKDASCGERVLFAEAKRDMMDRLPERGINPGGPIYMPSPSGSVALDVAYACFDSLPQLQARLFTSRSMMRNRLPPYGERRPWAVFGQEYLT